MSITIMGMQWGIAIKFTATEFIFEITFNNNCWEIYKGIKKIYKDTEY